MAATPFLHASGLVAIRDGRALFRALAVSVVAGEVLRIEGPNGAGKTTLLRILAGLDQDCEGSVTYPRAAAAGRPWREDVLYLGHLPGVKPSLTALENLAWLASLRGVPPRQDPGAALARVGLAGYEDVPVAAMSAGQKRRVALARLHVEVAPLWILDEPFTAIDRAGVGDLEETLAAHARSGGAVIVTTHHPLALPVRSLQLGGGARVA